MNQPEPQHSSKLFDHLLGAHVRAVYKVGNKPVTIRDGIIIQVIPAPKKTLSWKYYVVYDPSSDLVFSWVKSLVCSWVSLE